MATLQHCGLRTEAAFLGGRVLVPGLPASRLGSHLTESFSGSNTVISEAPSSSDVVGPDGGLHGLLTALSCHLSPSCKSRTHLLEQQHAMRRGQHASTTQPLLPGGLQLVGEKNTAF